MKIIVKQIDFKLSESGVYKHNELRRDVSCYRGEKLTKIVQDNLDKYVVVATIETDPASETLDALDLGHKLTNSVDMPWYKNEDIEVSDFAREGCRSTSIGDIITLNDIDYMVDGCGFIALGQI